MQYSYNKDYWIVLRIINNRKNIVDINLHVSFCISANTPDEALLDIKQEII